MNTRAQISEHGRGLAGRSERKIYSRPRLEVYGDIKDITQKVYGIIDQNQSPNGGNNGMGDGPVAPLS